MSPIDAGAIFGEQGPFEDALIGRTDYSGWLYEITRYCAVDVRRCPWPDPCHRPDCHPILCPQCGEIEMSDEFGRVGCWACADPVPSDWERQHEDALEMTVGLLTRRTAW